MSEERPNHPIIDSLEQDLSYFQGAIKEVAYEILDNDLSKYPIFIAHELPLTIGELILDKDDFSTSWSFSATTMEELLENQVIQPDKEEEFKNIYKDPRKNICVFLISEKGGNFIFYPYKEEEQVNSGE